MSGPLLGAHASISGGTPLAIDRAEALAASACQIFVKSPNQWRAKGIAPGEAEAFRSRQAESPVRKVVAHAAYLINLAAVDSAVRERSVAALVDELQRCRQLALRGLVLHPGAHMGAGETTGLARIARCLDRVLSRLPTDAPPVLLENTAGQGTVLGYRLEHLADIIDRSAHGERIGICIDTCHAFAAGYAIDDPEGLQAFLERIESLFGLDRLGAMHLNDSRFPFDSRRDRHANIGQGEIGLQPFADLLTSDHVVDVPLILETPIGDDGKGHERDLATLRRLIQ